MKLKSNIGYSAVAAAVAVACGAAYAAVPTGAGVTTVFSAEGGATAAATSVVTSTVSVVLGSDYIANDTVELAVTGASFVAGTSTVATSANNAAVTCGSSPNTLTLGFLSRSATSANYRVTGTGGSQNGLTCSFALPILASSLATAGTVPRVSWTAKTAQSGLVFDDATRVATLGSVKSQFASPSSVGTLNGVVNVDSGRYQFTAHDTTSLLSTGGSSDTLTFTLANDTALTNPAVLTSVVAVISGDFSFVDGGDTTAGCSVADLSAGHGRISATGGTLSINSACSALTFTATTAGASVISFGTSSSSTTPTNGGIITAPQSFTVAPLTYTYGGPSGTTGSTGSASVAFSTTGSAGAWSLNGSISKISYMPYGTGISRIVYITNRSTQTGGVSATAINDAGVACSIANVGTSTKGSVTNLSTGLDAGVAACYGASYTGKVAFEITANIPGNKAEVYSAYNVNGNRVLVVNDTNGKTVTGGATQN